jgi:predicted permease
MGVERLSWRRRRARRTQQAREIDAEIQAHLDLEAAEQSDRGLASREADDAARRTFGNVLLVREETRAVWRWTAVEQFAQDARYAIRTMRRSPGFALTAVLSLALGIGANAAIFSLADALLFRPLAIREPQLVVVIRSTSPEGAFEGLSYPDFKDFRDRSQAFDGLIAHRLTLLGVATSPDAPPQMRMGMKVSRDFFQTLGVVPALGRAFLPDETEVPGREAVAVLSHHFWVNEFGSDPEVVGRTMQVSQTRVTIVGVAPRWFTGMDPLIQPYLYVPAVLGEKIAGPGGHMLDKRDERGFVVRGRLRDSITPERAQAELAGIATALEEQYPQTNRRRGVAVRTEIEMRREQTPALFPIMTVLLVLAGLVLAIVCANVANLFLARARSRGREIAIRLAIGAGQVRLVRQLLTESAVLALAGGIAGVGLGALAVEYLRSIRLPTDTPIVFALQMDTRVLLFSLAAALVSALAFGLAPASQAARADLVAALKRTDAGAGPSRRRMIGRQTLVIGQLALAVVLLVTTAIMLEAFRRMLVLDPGFRTEHILMMEFNTGLAGYSEAETREFYRQLVERARALPEVRGASLARAVPFRPNFTNQLVVPERYQLRAGQEGVGVSTNPVDETYFETMRIPILRGRAFTIDDRPDARRTAVVNDTFATLYWPNREAIGKRFRLGAKGEWVEVVGVARTARYETIAEPPTPHIYLPLSQHPQSRLTLLVHTAGDPLAVADPLRQIVRAADAKLPIFNVRALHTMHQDGALGSQRLIVQLVSAMGLLGLGLALIGLYALVAYSVSRRQREFGVRMSIGATRGDILRLVLREGVRLAAVGIFVGLVVSVPIQRALHATLVGLGPLSPWALVVVPLGLVAVTIAACLAPAWRASLVDPTTVLRLE